MKPTSAQASGEMPLLTLIYRRPGFLLRRAHQLSVAMFEEACSDLALTPPQYGVLTVVAQNPGCDQSTVARALGFDRVTTLRIVRGLEARLLVQREPGTRSRPLLISRAGRVLLQRARKRADAVTERLMAPLNADQRQALTGLLTQLCAAHEGGSRTPLRAPG
jgi:MarR family transcriptional regulator, lower aerobic nicotinate degradation pathway regulator